MFFHFNDHCQKHFNRWCHSMETLVEPLDLYPPLSQGQEVKLSHRAVLMAEELVIPSLSGMPIRLALNMTSLLSVRLKGSGNYRDPSHLSLAGFIKPK